MKENGLYILTFFSILILISFINELIFFVDKCFSNFSHAIYGLFWIFLVLYLMYKKLKKIDGIDPGQFFILSIFAGLFISILNMLVAEKLGVDKLIEKKYVGVYGQTIEYDSLNEKEIFIDHKTFVFYENDSRARRELKKLENEYEESYQDDFIFWQTAFVKGFTPKYITDFAGINSFSKKLTLFFTVGPVFILETFINSIMNSWLLVLLPVISLLFKVKILEKEIEPFYNIFKINKTVTN